MTAGPADVTTPEQEPEAVARLLRHWLPAQRWFAGKDRPIDDVRLVSATRLHDDGPRLWHLLVDVVQQGSVATYQVPVTVRPWHQDRLEHVLVGELGGHAIYDALHDKEATAELARRIAASDRSTGALDFHREEGADVPVDQPSIVLTGEQSNSSLVYGDSALLKVFRRISPGVNPDVEIHDALTRAGCTYVAPLLGWIDGRWTGSDGQQHEASLAMLQTFLVTATDGWRLATTSVRDLYAEGDLHADEVGGDFAGEARRLGAATAEVHRVMAQVLQTGTMSAADMQQRAGDMRGRLEEALEVVPSLRPHASGLHQAFRDLAELAGPVPVQRVHGDYHLGQVMRTVTGWKLLDFEGEPAKPLAERVALDSPVRDVAGMLRSFDYAARHLLVADHPGNEQIAYRASEWADRNRSAFCDGYATVAGRDPREDDVLLRAYETDKAVYEAVYEARNRPTWLPIPLAAIDRLASTTTPGRYVP